jgi:hypothetical protein
MKKMLLIILLSFSNYFVQSQNVTLNIRALIQGFYRGSGTMIAAIDSINYPNVCDTMTVNLLDTTGPSYTILYSVTSTISTSGYGSFVFPDAVLGETFFIQLSHRNALTVFSKYPVTFDNTNMSYDFTVIPFQLCAEALNSGDGFALLFSGDLNHDGMIDGNDMNYVDNAQAVNLTGYVAEDLNGDQLVNISDMAILDVSATFGVFSLYPNSCLTSSLTGTIKHESLTISPNPTNGVVNISLDNVKSGNINVFNMLGEEIYSEAVTPQSTNHLQLDLHAPPGIYFIRLNSVNRQLVGKVIIE